jgi:LDH2 family malate/lactate/ureidoglycolate dehydrogenase
MIKNALPPVVHAGTMREYIGTLYAAFGASSVDAAEIANHLIAASLEGHDSHGILRAPEYLDRVEQGLINPQAHPTVTAEGSAWGAVDGNWGFGQSTSRFAMELAISKARQTGVSCVTVRNGNHMGRVGHYTSMAAREGMAGLGCANLNGSSNLVAPCGGTDRRLGTNPFSVAFPLDREPAFMADFATSASAEGKIQWRRNCGVPVPDGYIIDHDGNPTNDSWSLYREPLGSLLPLGGPALHKGYALGLIVELLAGGLSGGGCVNPEGGRHGNACWYVAIDIDVLTPLEQFKAKAGRMIDYVKTANTQSGTEEILYPGEPEYRSRLHRLAHGIPVDPVTIDRLATKARAVGITSPEFF